MAPSPHEIEVVWVDDEPRCRACGRPVTYARRRMVPGSRWVHKRAKTR